MCTGTVSNLINTILHLFLYCYKIYNLTGSPYKNPYVSLQEGISVLALHIILPSSVANAGVMHKCELCIFCNAIVTIIINLKHKLPSLYYNYAS